MIICGQYQNILIFGAHFVPSFQVVNLDDEDIPMPSVDHSIVELDDGEHSCSPICCNAHSPLPGPPGDEGDVEVVWHRASGRASTPPLGPPGDTYDPFQVGLSSIVKVFQIQCSLSAE